MARQIADHGTTHLMMGVGSPKSEVWVHQHRHSLGDLYAFGFGAGLDFLAGTQRRAPVFMRRIVGMPIAPPVDDSTVASIKNCRRISAFRAPIALRTPISLVRSVTEISMMFMTPIPPTSNPTELMMPVSATSAPVS